jgi:hypothetical protein
VLVALLFLADVTLEKNSSPVIITSRRSGLPEPSHHPKGIHILTGSPAPAPDMTSQAVFDAQPKVESKVESKAESKALTKIDLEARAARAEAPPARNRRVTQPMDHEQNHYPQIQLGDGFQLKVNGTF